MNKAFIVSKKDARQYLTVIILSLLTIGIICAFRGPAVHIVAVWFFVICVVSMSKVDIMHPYAWFSAILALYSTAYSILSVIRLTGNYSYEQLLYPVIALSTSLLFIGTRKKTNVNRFLLKKDQKTFDYYYLDAVIIVLFVICALLSMLLLRSGFWGKTEMKQANNLSYRIGVYAVRFLTLFTIVRVSNRIQLQKKYIWCLILTGVATVAFSLSTGERDTYIRFFVVTLFILYSAGIIKKRHFLILIPLSMILLTLSVEFKYYFLRGTLNGSFSISNIFEGFLSSDFSAAGRNLQYLIDRPWTKGNFGFGMVITELLYPILPRSIVTNPDYWFNYVVHAGGSHGNAFTLVGTGYVIGGILGVIVVFAIVGYIIKGLYRRADRNLFYFSAYIYSITIIMISIRGSLNSIINCLLKEVGICFLFCYLMNRLVAVPLIGVSNSR